MKKQFHAKICLVLVLVILAMPLSAFAATGTTWDSCSKKAPKCPLSEFPDLKANAWYHDCIHYCIDQGIMSGTDKGVFLPYDSTNRAMVYSILYRLAGSPTVWAFAKTQDDWPQYFDDVENWRWYYPAITWAVNNEIALTSVIRGERSADEPFEESEPWNFSPLAIISREEIATIFYRYCVSRGLDVTPVIPADTTATATDLEAYEPLRQFKDRDTISNWALDALIWANSVGVMEGRANGCLDPKEPANRAEIASFFYKFIRVLNTMQPAAHE